MKIKLAKSQINKTINDFYIQQYSTWRNNLALKEFEAKFFILYKDFEIHLKDISPGALKLYLYYGFNARNETGILWHGIESISNYFDVSEKTINNWNKELLDRGLVARESKNNRRNKTTYLLPFSLNLINLRDKNLINTPEFNSVYGSQSRAFHLFQWRKGNKDNKEYNEPYHSLILLYEKEFKKGSYKQYTAFHWSITDENENKLIDTDNVTTDIFVFKSDLEITNVNVAIEGIAVNTKLSLKLDTVLYNLVKELINEKTDLDAYKEVKLITKEGNASEKM